MTQTPTDLQAAFDAAAKQFQSSEEGARLARRRDEQARQAYLARLEPLASDEVKRLRENPEILEAARNVARRNETINNASLEVVELRELATAALLEAPGRRRLEELAVKAGVGVEDVIVDLADIVLQKEKQAMKNQGPARIVPPDRKRER